LLAQGDYLATLYCVVTAHLRGATQFNYPRLRQELKNLQKSEMQVSSSHLLLWARAVHLILTTTEAYCSKLQARIFLKTLHIGRVKHSKEATERMARTEETTRKKIGTYVFAFATIIPALIVSGFMPDWNVLPFWGWGLIAAIGGALGGFIWGEGREWQAALAGFVSGFSCILALEGYVHIRNHISHTYLSIELLIPFGLAMLPGYFILRHLAPAEMSREIAVPVEDEEASAIGTTELV
jgi:dolichol kinase